MGCLPDVGGCGGVNEHRGVAAIRRHAHRLSSTRRIDMDTEKTEKESAFKDGDIRVYRLGHWCIANGGNKVDVPIDGDNREVIPAIEAAKAYADSIGGRFCGILCGGTFSVARGTDRKWHIYFDGEMADSRLSYETEDEACRHASWMASTYKTAYVEPVSMTGKRERVRSFYAVAREDLLNANAFGRCYWSEDGKLTSSGNAWGTSSLSAANASAAYLNEKRGDGYYVVVSVHNEKRVTVV